MRAPRVGLAGLVAFIAACDGDAAGAGERWEGTVDTAAGGHVVVHNAGAGVWDEGEAWTVTEEVRIGSVDGSGPEVFGSIRGLTVDEGGRIWVLDGQAKDVRVFDSAGAHVRTIGQPGGGPGEFGDPVHISTAPDGRIWVMDPRNARLSIFDTTGAYVDGHTVRGGFMILPWPGGFDDRGRYYAPLPVMAEEFRIALGRYDRAFNPTDTLEIPSDPVERDYYRIERDGVTRVMASIPFQGSMIWRIAPDGTLWALVTDQYRLVRLDGGDTVQVLTRAFDPVPVAPADREKALGDLEWFTNQGGRVDPSKIPQTKPPTVSFFVDETGHVWVATISGDAVPEGESWASRVGSRWDVFGPDGRLLGKLELPVDLSLNPAPLVRDGVLYGVTRNELDVPFVVRARIGRPSAGVGRPDA